MQVAAGAQLRNYWQLDLTLGKSWNTWDDKLTRGGPTTIRPGHRQPGPRRLERRPPALLGHRVRPQLSNREFGSRSRQYPATLNLRPFDGAHPLRRRPRYLHAHTDAQYLATVPDATATSTFGARYVFGGLDQNEWSIPLRVNLVLVAEALPPALHPGPPLDGRLPGRSGSSPPRAPTTSPSTGWTWARSRGTPSCRVYVIDPDGAGAAPPFRIPVPDFNFKSLRVNAVLRWEFRPGSAAYVVWTQRRQDGAQPRRPRLRPRPRRPLLGPRRRRLHGQARLVAGALKAERSTARLFGTAVAASSLPSISSDTQPWKPALRRMPAMRG